MKMYGWIQEQSQETCGMARWHRQNGALCTVKDQQQVKTDQHNISSMYEDKKLISFLSLSDIFRPKLLFQSNDMNKSKGRESLLLTGRKAIERI